MLARWGVLVVVAGALAGGCVDLRYPEGATRDGGPRAPQLPIGRGCLDNKECASGFCVDGVCCNGECLGPCHTCRKDLASAGLCMVADLDTNARLQCRENGCAEIAKCDGAGHCQKKNQGEICEAPKCDGLELTLAGRCDDMGTCIQGQTQRCDPYICGDMKCKSSCTSSADCRNGSKCENGLCGKKGLGTACDVSDECVEGSVCASGVCCKTLCPGPCRSCALEGSAGTCTAVPAGTKDPGGNCATMDASTCQSDGTCDGAGGCRLHVAGKACAPASCANASLRPAATCDGKGKCQTPTTVTCGGYTCASPVECRKTCTSDPDCASPSICGKDGACGGLSAQYFRQTNLTDLAFMRTDARVDFDWGGGSPNALLNADNFSVRWRGKITPRFSQMYKFYVGSDDGERLFINGEQIINNFVRHASVPEDVSKAVPLIAGQPVDIQVEYFENGGDASIRLSWSSDSEPKAVIPTSALSPQ